MDNTFASVEWLSQSSRKDKLDNKKIPNLPLVPRDNPLSFCTWKPVIQPFPSYLHVTPYPGTQRQTYGNNYLLPSLWDNDRSFHSSDSDFSYYTSEGSRLSPFIEQLQRDLEASHSPIYNGFFPTSQSLFLNNTQDSTSSQDLPTSSQGVYEKQADQSSFSEDFALPGSCSSTESGYDSETSRSSSTTPVGESSDTSDEEGKVGRRLRTAFTTDQITCLENTFQKHRYLGASERRKLAAKLQLSEVQIKTWFQNRRMKQKREMQEGRQGPFHPAHFYRMYGYPPQPITPFQYIQPGQQHLAHSPLMDSIPANYRSPPPARL